MGNCGQFVSWWDGEYDGYCELEVDHEGCHFDGMSYYNDNMEQSPDDCNCPTCEDAND